MTDYDKGYRERVARSGANTINALLARHGIQLDSWAHLVEDIDSPLVYTVTDVHKKGPVTLDLRDEYTLLTLGMVSDVHDRNWMFKPVGLWVYQTSEGRADNGSLSQYCIDKRRELASRLTYKVEGERIYLQTSGKDNQDAKRLFLRVLGYKYVTTAKLADGHTAECYDPDFESMFEGPDGTHYNAAERAYQLLLRLSGRQSLPMSKAGYINLFRVLPDERHVLASAGWKLSTYPDDKSYDESTIAVTRE